MWPIEIRIGCPFEYVVLLLPSQTVLPVARFGYRGVRSASLNNPLSGGDVARLGKLNGLTVLRSCPSMRGFALNGGGLWRAVHGSCGVQEYDHGSQRAIQRAPPGH